MNLIDFAKTMPETFSDEEFVDRVNEVVDLKAVQSLEAHERQSLYDFAQYLADYMLLVKECLEESETGDEDVPLIEYRGPFIENVLTRSPGRQLDRSQLQTFGIDPTIN